MIKRAPTLLLAGALILATALAALGGTAIGQTGATPTPEPTRSDPRQAVDVTLTVFAAASLTNAFTEIGQRFEAHNPGVKVVFSFAGSQQLAQQINQGAPADVFASANQAQMASAIEGGRISAAQIFVLNRLIVVMPAQNPAGLQTLQDLARPGLKVVLAAEPVPAGQSTLDFLDKASRDPVLGADYKAAVLANVVSYEDSVRQVLAKVALGEADAGVVYTTDVGVDRNRVSTLVIPDNLNNLTEYPIAALNDSANDYWARGFVRFVLSGDGQSILSKYGFIPAAPTRTSK